MASEGCNVAGCSSNNTGSLPGSLGRDYRNKQKNSENSDDELDDSSKAIQTQSLERVKSERNVAINQPEEDRRRRTIIIEKKNNTYGFTLQTYGIHYRKEQEIEMITYVDSVEYDGPAYRAGMREGDVILSINGIDMEKADHKTLVDLIKKCETRMRMVVLFEDCVRKVALHMRYIHLQNKLQDKINELERACLQERQLITGKWKTHSLPARKKTTVDGISPSDIHDNETTNDDVQIPILYRPAISTEDVVNIGHPRNQQILQQQQQQQILVPQPPDQFIVAYQYLDPTYRYVLKPSTSNSSGEYFISVGPQRSPSECHYILTRDGSEIFRRNDQESNQRILQQSIQQSPATQQQSSQQNQQQFPCCDHPEYEECNSISAQKTENSGRTSRKSSMKHCHGHSCNPCLGNFGRRKSIDKNGSEDNTSLDAYDLAGSPCCATHCVPTRRRSRNTKEHHHHHHKHKHRDKDSNSKDRQRPRSQSHASPDVTGGHHHHHHNHQHRNTNQQSQQPAIQQSTTLHHQHSSASNSSRSKYFNLSANLASHCSLHSCTSSEFAPADSASYTTSLSTDTLYWDPQSEGNSRQPSTKSRQSFHQSQTLQPGQQQIVTSNSKGQQLIQKGFPLQPQTGTIYQQRYTTCLHPTQIQPIQQMYQTPVCVTKPKSWDNLTTKAFGGYGFGYGYLDTVGPKPPLKIQIDPTGATGATTNNASNIVHNSSHNIANNLNSQQHQQQIQHQRHSIPRKNPYGRYSTYTDVENYAPPPSQFVEEIVTVFVKKTEEMVTEKCVPNQPQILKNNSNTNLCNNKSGK